MHFTLFRRDSRSKRRLTRQRKLRHLTDLDIVGLSSPIIQSQPSVSSGSKSAPSWPRTPRDFHSLPVPSPELFAVLRRREAGLSLSTKSGCCPLPSPKEAASGGEREDVDGVDFSNGDGAVGRLAHQTIYKCVEHVDVASAGSILGRGKRILTDTNSGENIQHNFRLSFPAKSTPCSGFSSPTLSPRRSSVGDCFPSAQIVPQGLQFRCAPELPAVDISYSAQTSPDKFVASAEHSPLHSPAARSPGPKSSTPTGAASQLHSKTSSDGSTSWPDVNRTIIVHPLPLPPRAAVTRTSLGFFSQPAVRSEVSSMSSQWQKGKLIGSGTFGKVYVATNRETGASCAMKEVSLIPDDAKCAESIKQLEQEIKVLSQLKHQNIVQYYGSEIVDDHFYIYLEYVHPGSISKYIRDNCGAMTESVVRNFTRHILSGLAYLHSTKTIHRDIKGGNLLVDAAGVVKLADFGTAKHLSGQAAELSLKGSPYWMAPEVMQAVMQKDSDYDLAVDIWSLGCTIIEMFTGKPPWIELEWAAAMFKVLRNETPPIPETLSAEGKDFLQLCFQRNPADRPSASMLLEHPFVNNSHHLEIPSCIQAISRMKLMDVESPSDRTSSMQISPGTQASKGQPSPNGETGQSHTEASKPAAASRHSPRSTLEALPNLSPPHSNGQMHLPSPPNVLNGKHLGARDNHRYPIPSSVRQVPHLFRRSLIGFPQKNQCMLPFQT
ncbi:mitogen-activated protein kinase kinase kinase 5-like [Magnolia sinica]|uniref:mitogen-activated protein kinase kinase kinase 5-like n=1 Tax=Magnolia sinica TaxID=86752 RepID=UPI00265B4BC1|nr:mitogen-activated protein kinase kinase kinase 5-like [Magnolia sinica]